MGDKPAGEPPEYTERPRGVAVGGSERAAGEAAAYTEKPGGVAVDYAERSSGETGGSVESEGADYSQIFASTDDPVVSSGDNFLISRISGYCEREQGEPIG